MLQSAFRYLYHDLRLTWREPSTRMFLMMPLLFFAMLFWGIPALLAAYPVVQDSGPLLLDGIVFQGGLMFGFVSGFLLLDEKDLGLITVYRISPVSFARLLLLKLAFPFLATFAYALICLAFNPILPMRGIQLLVTAMHFSLITPLGALAVGALAKNKVEGLTWFKLVDLLLIVPFLGFFLPSPWDKWLYVFPTHWVFDSLQALSMGNAYRFWIDHAVGIPLLGLLLCLFGWVFERRAD